MVKRAFPRVLISCITSIFVLTAFGCVDTENRYDYLLDDIENRKELEELLHLLEGAEANPESRFVVLQQIVRILHRESTLEKTNLFLTTHAEQHPDDPFNGYYLYIVAQNYLEQEAYPFAVHYLERILRNYPDLLVHGRSIHLNCMKNLISLSSNTEHKAGYYKELLTRFRDEINVGSTYYYLGKTYEELGEWDLALQAYINYLKYPDTRIPGSPGAYEDTRRMVMLSTYDNTSWAMPDLNDLIGAIKWTIHNGRPGDLANLMSRIDFFTTAWEQKEDDAEDVIQFNIDYFLTPRIWYSQEIDENSNAREAYLRTTGWSYRISTWYLYFRKLHFPADPDIHGRWEWAGIYFGEKPFAGSSDT